MKKKIFTLGGGLVVIVIIGILVGLLLPAMRAARDRSHRALVRDRGMGILVYYEVVEAEQNTDPGFNPLVDDPFSFPDVNIEIPLYEEFMFSENP